MASTTMKKFDVIVLGVGSMGAATCYYLAKEGLSVLGLEQFDIPNELSSHTGQSRLIRKAYFEHPAYVPLLQKAYENWAHLENISNEKVYHETGLLYFGKAGSKLINGIHESASKYQIQLDTIDEPDLHQRYPSFHMPAGYVSFLEPRAGFITPEKAIRLYTGKAKALGASIKQNTIVLAWEKTEDGIMVQTKEQDFYAAKLVITAGPWAGKLAPALSPLLTVTRQKIWWVNTTDNNSFSLGKFPCWIIADDNWPGIFYGFPILPSALFEGPQGFKLAWHYPGEVINPDNKYDHIPGLDEEMNIRFMDQFFPGVYTNTLATKTCLYTNTPDEHFIIDFLPGYKKEIVIAAGFSGHGFKFASAIGEILSDLVVHGSTEISIEFLNISRFTESIYFQSL
ncbi:MAG: N-methyl-L-tryptophan oxidase [Bacteroidota bacterium]